MTDYEKISKLLKLRQETMPAGQAENDFLSNISHELRTPMNGVLGLLDLLSETQLDDEQAQFVSALKKSADSLMRVISDLLDYSKARSGSLKVSRINFDLRVLMDNIRKEAGAKAAAAGLSMKVGVQAKVPSRLVGDPEKLRQILYHLVDNAVKFTTRGRVDLFVRLVSETAGQAVLVFEVVDTGMGISSGHVDKIFDSFFQGDASSTRERGGTGIGLALSKGLIHALGGDIHVNSVPGKGSVFSVRLSFTKQADNPDVMLSIPDTLKNRTVMIADADESSPSDSDPMDVILGVRGDRSVRRPAGH